MTKELPVVVHFNLINDGEIKGYLPEQAEELATGFDVRNAGPKLVLKPFQKAKIPLGFRAFIPEGWCFELRARSSTFTKKDLVSLYGTIDESYTGQWLFAAQYIPECSFTSNYLEGVVLFNTELVIEHGEKIAQIVLLPRYTFAVNSISDEKFLKLEANRGTQRGSGGFGSTG
jgi:dUTPase